MSQTTARPAQPPGRWKLFAPDPRHVDRFGLLLTVTIVAVVFLSLVDLRASESTLMERLGIVLVAVFVGATLQIAMRSAGIAARYRRIADAIILVGILGSAAIALAGPSGAGSRIGIPNIPWTAISLAAPAMVIGRLLTHRRVNAQTMFGAVAAYLLIALAFTLVYLAIEGVAGRPFFGSEQPTTSFMYYSLTTLTTVGFGDLSTAEPIGRLFSTMEAVTGQVYLVTFVGFVVGVLVGQRGGSGS